VNIFDIILNPEIKVENLKKNKTLSKISIFINIFIKSGSDNDAIMAKPAIAIAIIVADRTIKMGQRVVITMTSL